MKGAHRYGVPPFFGAIMSDQPVNPVCGERFDRLDDDRHRHRC